MSVTSIPTSRKIRGAQRRTNLVEDFDWLTSCGESAEYAATRLGVSLSYLDHVLYKDGGPDHLRRIVGVALSAQRHTNRKAA